ncbi:MAG: serine/threonine-protein kinase, partial [Planctomycetota bacterium]
MTTTWYCIPCDLNVIVGSECPKCGCVDRRAKTVVAGETSPDLVDFGGQFLLAGTQVGGYKIIRPVGRGGMGVVYEARQLSLNRSVALKTLDAALSQDANFLERFDKEVQALVALNHPNITAIIDRGREGTFYYFVMEYVEGVSLRHMIANGPLSPDNAIQLVDQLCQALSFAHSRDVLHRDIKPENIMVTKEGALKVLDFGLAKFKDDDHRGSRITGAKTVLGTYDYMAPEQRRSGDTDQRSDIYSLGVVFYEMLTGELPVGRFDLPSLRIKGVHRAIDTVVAKTLDSDPKRRYEKASLIIQDIRRIRSRLVSADTQEVDLDPQLPPVQSVLGFICAVLGVLVTGILWFFLPIG